MIKKLRSSVQLWLPILFFTATNLVAINYQRPAPEAVSSAPAIVNSPSAHSGSSMKAAEASGTVRGGGDVASAPTTSNPLAKSSPNGSVVTTKNPEAVKSFAKNNGLNIKKTTPLPNGQSLIVLDESKDHPAARILAESDIDAEVSTNYTYRALYTPTNPDTYYNDQWNLTKIQAPQAWDITTGDSGSVIAVVDTGVLFSQTVNGATYTQPDFPDNRRWKNSSENGSTLSEGNAPNCTSRGLALDKACNNIDDDGNGKIDDWQGWDFMGGFSGSGYQCPNHSPALTEATYVQEDNDPQPYSCDSPTYPSAFNKDHYDGSCSFGVSACYIGHGTMVGSVAAATSNNGQLIAGIDHSAKIMNLRVLDGYGFTTTDIVAAAVSYAGSKGADVINMSLAVSDCSTDFVDPILENAMLSAKNNGSVIVAASGNENIASVCYPASSTNALAVGSTDQNDLRSSFSNYGHGLDVVAPGSGIPVANAPSANINSNYYSSANGTSLATPHVAGLAGLLRAMRPDASANEIMNLIKDRADIVPAMNGRSFTTELGFGRINLYNSVRVAEGSSRPIYRLYNSSRGCYLYTTSPNQKRYLDKIDYLYQGIDSWEAIDPAQTSHPVTKSHVCS